MQFSKLDMIEQQPALDHDAWKWMMDYCLTHRLPPAQQWAWDIAKNAYINTVAKHKVETKLELSDKLITAGNGECL